VRKGSPSLRRPTIHFMSSQLLDFSFNWTSHFHINSNPINFKTILNARCTKVSISYEILTKCWLNSNRWLIRVLVVKLRETKNMSHTCSSKRGEAWRARAQAQATTLPESRDFVRVQNTSRNMVLLS
jgi:hypothetical protein